MFSSHIFRSDSRESVDDVDDEDTEHGVENEFFSHMVRFFLLHLFEHVHDVIHAVIFLGVIRCVFRFAGIGNAVVVRIHIIAKFVFSRFREGSEECWCLVLSFRLVMRDRDERVLGGHAIRLLLRLMLNRRFGQGWVGWRPKIG